MALILEGEEINSEDNISCKFFFCNNSEQLNDLLVLFCFFFFLVVSLLHTPVVS